MNNNEFFFQNKECPYFPCHKDVKLDEFNCMFCYCPLYMLGTKCGGNYKILDNGIKDCSDCTVCHGINASKIVMGKFEIINANMLV